MSVTRDRGLEQPEVDRGVKIRLLGPASVTRGDDMVALAPRERTVLARLAVDPEHVVSAEAMIDALWGADPPATARKTLQTYVAALRRKLGAEVVATEAGGYRLSSAASVDLADFRRDARRVAELAAAGDLDTVRETAARALDSWRGEPLAALEAWPGAAPIVTALIELRDATEQTLARSMLARGEAGLAVSVLEELVSREPLREQAWGLLMQALAEQGRRADALSAFLRARTALVDVGLEPGPDLRRLQERLLEADTAPSPPAPRGHDRAPRTLPQPTTSLIAREDDVARVRKLLREHRLVTVSGPGGVGKTRLAIEAARSWSEATGCPAVLVELAGASDLADVVAGIVQSLAVRGEAGSRPLDLLITALEGRDVLLVLDNAEQVVDGVAAAVVEVLLRTQGPRILSTSRVRLDVDGEALWHLAPLPLPDDGETGGPAVELFLDRALAVRPDLATGTEDLALYADIVRRLDGLPLAIELAAARCATLGPRDLLARLHDRFAVLRRGPRSLPDRHRALHAVLDSSWTLLSDSERNALVVVSSFPGGATSVALEAVGKTDVLTDVAQLVDHSLVRLDPGLGRYHVLVTVRDYANERLAELDFDDPSDRFVLWAVGQAETLDAGLRSADEGRAVVELAAELPNLRAAFDLLGTAGRGHEQIRLVAALAAYLSWRARPDIAGWASAAVGPQNSGLHGFARAACVTSWKFLAAGDYAAVVALAEMAEAHAPRGSEAEVAEVQTMRAHALAAAGDFPGALAAMRSAADNAAQAGNDYAHCMAEGGLALYGAISGGDVGRSAGHAAAARELAAAVGAPSLEAWAWYATAMVRLTSREDALGSIERAISAARAGQTRLVEALAERIWATIEPSLGAAETLASIARTVEQLRTSGNLFAAAGSLPWLVAPLTSLGAHEVALRVRTIAAEHATPGLPAPRMTAAVADSRGHVGPARAGALSREPVPGLAGAIDEVLALVAGALEGHGTRPQSDPSQSDPSQNQPYKSDGD